MKTTRLASPTPRQLLGDLVDALADHRDWLALAALLCLTVVGMGLARLPAAWNGAPDPVILVATATLGTLPTAESIGPYLPKTLAAYAAPDGEQLGDVPSGATYWIEGRSGATWLLIYVEGIGGFDPSRPGMVWVRASELRPELASVPDLATPVPQVVEVRQQVVYVAPLPPQPAPVAPASGATAAFDGRMDEAAAAAQGAVFTTSGHMDGNARQAGPAQCSNEGRSCLGSKP